MTAKWGRRFRLPTIFCLVAIAHGSDPRPATHPSHDRSNPSHDREGVVNPSFPSPIEMAISANGSRLYVVCEGTNEVIEVDAVAGTVLRRVRVGQHPKSISLSETVWQRSRC